MFLSRFGRFLAWRSRLLYFCGLSLERNPAGIDQQLHLIGDYHDHHCEPHQR